MKPRKRPGPRPGFELKPWTAEQRERLAELAKSCGREEIASQMGLPMKEIRYRLRKYGLTVKHPLRFSYEEREHIFKTVGEHGYIKAQELLGMSMNHLKSLVSKHKHFYNSVTADPLTAIKIQRAARIHAFKNKKPDVAKAFEMFALNEWVRTRRADMTWLWSDFWRDHNDTGKLSTEKGQAKSNMTVNALSLDGYDKEAPRQSSQDLENKNYVIFLMAKASINKMQRVCILLKYREDWDQEKIAELLGVTASRVSQVISEAIMKLRQAAVRLESESESV